MLGEVVNSMPWLTSTSSEFKEIQRWKGNGETSIDNYKNAESCLDLCKDWRTIFLFEFCDYLRVRHGTEAPTEVMVDSTE